MLNIELSAGCLLRHCIPLLQATATLWNDTVCTVFNEIPLEFPPNDTRSVEAVIQIMLDDERWVVREIRKNLEVARYDAELARRAANAGVDEYTEAYWFLMDDYEPHIDFNKLYAEAFEKRRLQRLKGADVHSSTQG